MAENKIDIPIRAYDEATNTFKRVEQQAEHTHGILQRLFQSSKDLNRESRASGEMAFERILHAGGAAGLATLAFEMMGKTAEAATESLGQLHAGLIDERQAIGQTAQGFVESIPIFNSWVENMGKVRIAVQQGIVRPDQFLNSHHSQ